MPVEALTGDADEEIARLHLAGVEAHGVHWRQIRPLACSGGSPVRQSPRALIEALRDPVAAPALALIHRRGGRERLRLGAPL